MFVVLHLTGRTWTFSGFSDAANGDDAIAEYEQRGDHLVALKWDDERVEGSKETTTTLSTGPPADPTAKLPAALVAEEERLSVDDPERLAVQKEEEAQREAVLADAKEPTP